MYVIKMKHTSAEPGVYTTEEQTATTETYAKMKYKRMLLRWFGILCPHIDYELYEKELHNAFYSVKQHIEDVSRMNLIRSHLQTLNLMDGANRSFEITMEGFESTAPVV